MAYSSWVAPEQFGCVRGKGTDMANLMVRGFLEHARLAKLSVFVLFLDLTKAFDLVVRELLMGWQQEFAENPVEFLETVGIPKEKAAQFTTEIDCVHSLLVELGGRRKGCCIDYLPAHWLMVQVW